MLAFIGWCVIPSMTFSTIGHMTLEDTILPTSKHVKVLYTVSFGYHLACYFFERDDRSSRHFAFIGTVLYLCWHERFTIPIGLILVLIVWPSLMSLKSPFDLHHTVTILLILFSWYFHFTNVGSLVMFANDVTDIPMLLLKSLKSKHCVKGSFANGSKESLFQICAGSLVFVFWIYYRVIFVINLIACIFASQLDFVRLCFAFGLSVLTCMNIYWLCLQMQKLTQVRVSNA